MPHFVDEPIRRVWERLGTTRDRIAEFCRRHRIREFSVFGSVLRDDFAPESDVDVLVDFQEGATPSFFRFLDVEEELAGLLGARKIDFLTRPSIDESDNYIRRAEILKSLRNLYVA